MATKTSQISLAFSLSSPAECETDYLAVQAGGLSIDISLPTAVSGHAHRFPHSKVAPWLLIPCSTAMGEFRVDVGLVLGRDAGATGEAPAIAANA